MPAQAATAVARSQLSEQGQIAVAKWLATLCFHAIRAPDTNNL